MQKCLACDSANLAKDLSPAARGSGDLILDIANRGTRGLFSRRRHEKIKADLCRDCGTLRFFVQNPAID